MWKIKAVREYKEKKWDNEKEIERKRKREIEMCTVREQKSLW